MSTCSDQSEAEESVDEETASENDIEFNSEEDSELSDPSEVIEGAIGEVNSENVNFERLPTVEETSDKTNTEMPSKQELVLPKTVDEPVNVGVNAGILSTADFYTNELISSKGFNKNLFANSRLLVNLPLMAVASQFDECEIRCSGFPIQMIENELLPFFEKFGKVYKLKKIIHTHEVFVTYTTIEDAERAIKNVRQHGFNGRNISARANFKNATLFVKNIPFSATKCEVFRKFCAIAKGLVKVSMVSDTVDDRKNRGYCYIHYNNHQEAKAAKLQLETKKVFSLPLFVDWPDKKFGWSDKRTLYITNLRTDVHREDLREYFSVYGKVLVVEKNGTFATVQFQNTEDSTRAVRQIDRKLLGNENVEISTQRLVEDFKKKRKSTGMTLYISNLSSNITTSDLRKWFSVYGVVNEIEKNDSNATVRFQDSENAKRATREIDIRQLGHEVEISYKKPVEKLPNSHTIYVNNLRSGMTAPELREFFSVYGVVKEIDKSDQFASVRFQKSAHAKLAFRKLDKNLLGSEVEVSLKKIVPDSDTVYIENSTMDTKELRKCFSVYGDVIDIEKNGEFVSVRFVDKEIAKRAVREMEKKQPKMCISLSKKN